MGIETPRPTAAMKRKKSRLNGLGSPMGIETSYRYHVASGLISG